MHITVKGLAKAIFRGATLEPQKFKCDIESCNNIPNYTCEYYDKYDTYTASDYEGDGIALCKECFEKIQVFTSQLHAIVRE